MNAEKELGGTHMTVAETRGGAVPHSFELFPPRSDASALSLGLSIDRLAASNPSFFSVTFGAGGSTRDRSLTVLRYIREHTDIPVVAHLTSVASTTAEVTSQVREFLEAGITQFLALHGDPPKNGPDDEGEIRNTPELVQLILRVCTDHEPHVGVAAFPSGHPRATAPWQDVQALLAKQEAGAEFAITQVFFEATHYLDYLDHARDAGVTIPILPGIAPATRPRQLVRLAELNGHEPPTELLAALENAASPGLAAEIGIRWATDLATEVLAGGAPALHYFTFNQYEAALRVHERVAAIVH